ncbi:MAG TPA: tRNA lysidine(34) synthetase TilS [Nitrospira sp.]|nr:tRNA lysidine(34) synthetase TilS [Nitrospira sp.]
MTPGVQLAACKIGRRPWPGLLHRVVKTIRSRGLFERGQHVLVAVSGGPDSTALLRLLHRLKLSWRLTLTAVHFNYGLRGAESDADQAFVEAMCSRLDIPFRTMPLEVRNRARGLSLQTAARDLRYRAMHEMAQQCGADRIAVGHTANDQAETVLLWMLRGAGLTGLSGMPACRDDLVIRPLYETRRVELLAYLSDEGISFRQDSSNGKPIYLRNRIRQEVIPVLQRLVPSAVETLCKLADLCRDDDWYLSEHIQALSHSCIHPLPEGGWAIGRSFLQKTPVAVQRRIVRELLRRGESQCRSPRRDTVELVLRAVAKQNGISQFAIPSGSVAVDKDSVRFVLSKIPQRSLPPQPIPRILTVPGGMTWAGTGQYIQVQEVTRQQIDTMVPGKDRIVIDADRMSQPFVVRAWQAGDRFCPLGMKGRSKKLQDFFMDVKLSRADRRRIPLVVAPEGIVWVVGYRQDERWSVTPGTKRYLTLAVHPVQAEEGS